MKTASAAARCWLCIITLLGCFSSSGGHGGSAGGGAGAFCSVPEVGVASAPLYGASEEAELLELDVREQNAVVALVLRTPVRALCTGVLMAPDVVVTAAHCVDDWPVPPEVMVGADSDAPEWSTAAAGVEQHPELDLARVELERPVPASLAAVLPPLAAGALPLVNRRAQLAGFGLTENNTLGQRLFTDEIVINDDGNLVTVDGEGERGACLGDSGGPLLVRDGAGRVRVVGVLSQGSASCRNLDQYVVLHQAEDWLALPPVEQCP